MPPAFVNHLWQSSLFAAGVFALALILRNNRPQIRYWLWLVASVKFLVPFSLLVSVGRQVEIQTPPPPIATAMTEMAAQVSQPFDSIQPAYSEPAQLPAIPVVWVCGSITVLALWIRKALRLRQVVRNAAPLPDMLLGIPVRVSSILIEPGVVGLFRPVLLVPEGLLRSLTADQFAAIVAHELCHVRRRDNLAAAFHMGVEAIFWFHPLVWWIGSRLIEERERACDEEVLRRGTGHEIYAQSILSVCKFYVRSPLPCACGVTGADLKKRVRHIMGGTFGQQLTWPRKILLAASGVAVICLPLLLGALHINAQLSSTSRYDVASVRPSTATDQSSHFDLIPGGIQARNVTPSQLVGYAFELREFQVEGMPSWAKTTRFDIQAKGDNPQTIHPRDMVGAQRRDFIQQQRECLRNLLQERFHLSVKQDLKEHSGYILTIAKSGHKLKRSDVDERRQSMGTNVGARGRMNAKGVSLAMIADSLSGVLGRTVVDKTDLTGLWDGGMEWNSDPISTDASTSGPNSSIFTAIQEQLGLKLESKKVPTPIIVVERIEKPTEN
jgi:uncharacterized protein (TIGR03435 family)